MIVALFQYFNLKKFWYLSTDYNDKYTIIRVLKIPHYIIILYINIVVVNYIYTIHLAKN